MKRNVTICAGFFRIMLGPSGGHSFYVSTMGISRTPHHGISYSKRRKSADT